MRTNLAYIETVASDALARELETPLVPTIARQKASQVSLAIVAGFAVRDEAVEQREIDNSRSERRANIAQYRSHREEVAAELDKLGITPLAIVPKNAWERICTTSGLFRLEPNENGNVGISTELLNKFENRADHLLNGSIPLATWLIPTGVSGVCFALAFNWPWWGTGLATFAALVVFAIATLCIFISGDLSETSPGWKHVAWRKKLVRLQIRRFCKQPWEQVLKGFFPNGASESGNLQARVVLPEPPAEVLAKLVKAKGLKLKVAAVAEAIAFADAPGKILRREHDRVVEQREHDRPKGYRGYASYEEWREKCPIVYHEHGSAVAVIAQFGDFPVEQRVVDEVVNSEYLV